MDRLIPDKAILVKEVAAWELRRNAEKARIRWMFTVDRARAKLGRVYPHHCDGVLDANGFGNLLRDVDRKTVPCSRHPTSPMRSRNAFREKVVVAGAIGVPR